MGVKFFGQYLIEKGEIGAEHLRAALDLMDQHNRTLGELAVVGGILSVADTEKVNSEQRRRDLPFGQLAVEMGLLGEEQLDHLIHIQDRERLRIGEALVRVGALDNQRLGELLARHEAEQAQYRTGDVTLPDGLLSHALAAPVLDLLPKLMMRMGRIFARVGRGEVAIAVPKLSIQPAVRILGDAPLLICLACDDALAQRLSGSDPDADRELLEDGVGEFLNVLAGNAMGLVEQRGLATELAPPEGGFELGSGFLFPLAVNVGSAALYLEPL
jgi:hypothetical protein